MKALDGKKWKKPAKKVQRVKIITTERQETAKMCLRPQRGALVGYYTPKRSHLKIAVLPQCEAFSADFAGRRSICALRRAKITEGERVVLPVVALHGRFLCTNLGRRSISKGNGHPRA